MFHAEDPVCAKKKNPMGRPVCWYLEIWGQNNSLDFSLVCARQLCEFSQADCLPHVSVASSET